MVNTVIKNIKQYSYKLDKNILNELLYIGSKYSSVKNYVYSRFSGINSILPLGKDRKIRDEWVKTKFYEQWSILKRYLITSKCISFYMKRGLYHLK